MSDKDSTAKIKCQGLAGLIFGHNYQPVFNKEPMPIGSNLTNASDAVATAFFEYNTKRTYVHTECTRCGNRIGGVA